MFEKRRVLWEQAKKIWNDAYFIALQKCTLKTHEEINHFATSIANHAARRFIKHFELSGYSDDELLKLASEAENISGQNNGISHQ